MQRTFVVLALCALAASGCSACHDEHPYVPYAIGPGDGALASAGPAVAPSASAAAADGAAGFPHELAVVAPVGLSSWSVDGVSLEAPAGLTFVSAVVRDFDGDGANDAFALVHETDDAGRLVFFHGSPGAGPLAVASTFEAPPESSTGARGPGCTPVQKLSLVGPRAVFVELGTQCNGATGRRWIALVAGGGTARMRLAATLTDPPGTPTLAVDADTADRDGDGLPDVALHASLEGGGAPFEPGPRVAATLAWLDRPAGLGRDAAATEASFGALAASAVVRAKSPREAANVPLFVAQARSLWRAICADSGAPRLVGVAGTGSIPCGSARALEDLGLAEARSYVTVGDPLRAALAIDRAERPPASRTASRVAEATKLVTALAPIVTAPNVRAVAAVPQTQRGHEPAWGSLVFETTGKLLVRTRAGVVRVDPDTGDEASADGVAPWPSAVTGADGMHWIETYDPCDGVALRASFENGGDDMRDVALPVHPPLGDRCGGSRGAPAHVLPVAWGPAGLEAIVEGLPILVASDLSLAAPLAGFGAAPVALGGPRSAGGTSLVVPTAEGLLVRASSHAWLARAPVLDGTYADQRDCTITDDGQRVACVHDGKAWVGAWSAP